MKPTLTTLLCFTGLAVATLARADISISADIRLGKAPPPPPPEVIVIDNSPPPGPPPWAPAHGFRRNHTYYYYPGADVYYRTDDRVWFYIEGGSWRSAPALPGGIHIDFSRNVSLTMETDRPYDFHQRVVTYYPANYFVTKVKFKDGPDRGGYDKPGRGHDNYDGPGKGKGNGKGKGKEK